VTLNKDTDLLILSRLDDNGLFSICLTNKYFNRICGEIARKADFR
jgi:hypothetical protein